MGRENFEEYLKKHSTENQIDWDSRKEEWLKHVDEFYKLITEWLKEYIVQNKVQIRYNPITLEEDNIGFYNVKQLYLKIANQTVVFTPIGTILIGSRGRIDMEGRGGRIRFVLVDEKVIERNVKSHKSLPEQKKSTEHDQQTFKLKWKIAPIPPSNKLEELTENKFFDALIAVINDQRGSNRNVFYNAI